MLVASGPARFWVLVACSAWAFLNHSEAYWVFCGKSSPPEKPSIPLMKLNEIWLDIQIGAVVATVGALAMCADTMGKLLVFLGMNHSKATFWAPVCLVVFCAAFTYFCMWWNTHATGVLTSDVNVSTAPTLHVNLDILELHVKPTFEISSHL